MRLSGADPSVSRVHAGIVIPTTWADFSLGQYCRSSAWRLGRAAVVVADGIWRRRRRLALPSDRNSDPAALAGGGAPTAARPWLRIHLTPFLLNGYPCLLCPCVVCFKFLQPKVIEGKKIDCALADPHLPRLLGGAPQLFTTNLVFIHGGRGGEEDCVRGQRAQVRRRCFEAMHSFPLPSELDTKLSAPRKTGRAVRQEELDREREPLEVLREVSGLRHNTVRSPQQ